MNSTTGNIRGPPQSGPLGPLENSMPSPKGENKNMRQKTQKTVLTSG